MNVQVQFITNKVAPLLVEWDRHRNDYIDCYLIRSTRISDNRFLKLTKWEREIEDAAFDAMVIISNQITDIVDMFSGEGWKKVRKDLNVVLEPHGLYLKKRSYEGDRAAVYWSWDDVRYVDIGVESGEADYEDLSDCFG